MRSNQSHGSLEAGDPLLLACRIVVRHRESAHHERRNAARRRIHITGWGKCHSRCSVLGKSLGTPSVSAFPDVVAPDERFGGRHGCRRHHMRSLRPPTGAQRASPLRRRRPRPSSAAPTTTSATNTSASRSRPRPGSGRRSGIDNEIAADYSRLFAVTNLGSSSARFAPATRPRRDTFRGVGSPPRARGGGPGHVRSGARHERGPTPRTSRGERNRCGVGLPTPAAPLRRIRVGCSSTVNDAGGAGREADMTQVGGGSSWLTHLDQEIVQLPGGLSGSQPGVAAGSPRSSSGPSSSFSSRRAAG